MANFTPPVTIKENTYEMTCVCHIFGFFLALYPE